MVIKKRNLSIYLVLLSIIWAFSFDYILRENNLDKVATNINYLLYFAYSFFFIFQFLFPKQFLSEKRLRISCQRMTIPIFGYFFYSLLQIVLNPSNSELNYFIDNYSVVLPSIAIALFLGITFFNSALSLRITLQLLVYIMLIVVFFSEVISINIGKVSKLDFRTIGIFGQANNYGYFLSLLSILMSANIFKLIHIFKNNIFSISINILLLLLIIRTGSYGSLLVTLGAIGYLYFVTFQSFSTKTIATYSFVIVILISAMIYFITIVKSARSEALKGIIFGENTEEIAEQSTFDKRSVLIIAGIDAALRSPIIGQGLSARNYLIPGETKPRPVHNVFIVELMKGGLIGLLFYVLFYFQLWRIVKQVKNVRFKKIAIVLFFYLLFIDNTLTYSSFLSMNSGALAIGVIFILAFQQYRVPLMPKSSSATSQKY